MKDVTPTKDRVRVKATQQHTPAPPPARVASTPPAATPAPTNMLAIIAQAAANPQVNPGAMRELLDMQKEIMAQEAKTAFTRAFIALQAELPSIGQDGKIEIRERDNAGQRNGRVQQATPFATFNNIMKVVKPLLTAHGFSLSFSTAPTGDGRIDVRGLLEHEMGHSRETSFPLPAETSGSKNNVQGWGSSMSYGKRYASIALLNIVSHGPDDRDTDGNIDRNMKPTATGGLTEVDERPKVSKAQAAELHESIEWCGVGTQKFCDHYGIDKVEDLPVDLFAAAQKSCSDYHANQQTKRKG